MCSGGILSAGVPPVMPLGNGGSLRLALPPSADDVVGAAAGDGTTREAVVVGPAIVGDGDSAAVVVAFVATGDAAAGPPAVGACE